MEARVGIEPTHKGFAVLVVQSKLLTNVGISVGRRASKWLDFAPFYPLLAAKRQPDYRRRIPVSRHHHHDIISISLSSI
jgi:hypothetical protein